MITKNTVFILGAGASKPFGLPLGYELLQEVSRSLIYSRPKWMKNTGEINAYGHFIVREEEFKDDTKSSNELFQYLLNNGFRKQEIEKFRTDLVKSDLSSVDAFLEIRPEFLEIGKIAIAYNLIKFENNENLEKNSDWYSYVWRKLVSDFNEFGRNQVSFITYNYDRTLERYLLNKLVALYNIPIIEAHEMLKQIPIVHLHGQLGELQFNNQAGAVSFGEDVNGKNINRLKDIASPIKIIHENIGSDLEFTVSKEILKKAEAICFLGFGFHQKNLDRLELKTLSKTIHASGYGINHSDKISYERKNPWIQIGHPMHDCLKYLQNEFVIE